MNIRAIVCVDRRLMRSGAVTLGMVTAAIVTGALWLRLRAGHQHADATALTKAGGSTAERTNAALVTIR